MLNRRQLLSLLAGGLSAAAIAASDRATAFDFISPDTPTLEDFASTTLTDLEAQVRVVSADQTELGKINRDFGMAYRLRNLTMRYKEPNKLRMEGSIGCLIVNGPLRHFKVPALKLSKKDDLGNSPGKRYSLMDVGLLTRTSLAGTQGRYLKDEKVGDILAKVFEITYKGDESVRYQIWIDPHTHVIAKREWQDAMGKRKATFLYQEPKQVGTDLWVPTRIEIRNAEGVVAAVTSYSEVKVNQGLDDSLFQIA